MTKKNKNADIIISIFIIYNCFLAIFSNIISTNFKYENFIMLGVIYLTSLITYFLTIESSIVFIIFIDFIYSSIILYRHLVKLEELQLSTFYWILLIPITTTIIYNLRKVIKG
ncbi:MULTISPECIES: hypothetical protein [Clostridium]|jgi:hypothetical protein|nr:MULTISPECIES: hypothetical protein [Clostridium]MBS5305675.1 hypothetical protein [Clostridium sp.]MBU6136274.1 hypothetical protein [Clostridium tertium]MDB1954448.1 hypothetical protein [Clostridium tertium]MDB1965653.1 hypothetical protein [Clostridium tertium]MDI9216773.1 hypothetical protein [Clostridium tertium]